MAKKKSLHLFLGIVLILLGAWFGLIAARAAFNLIRNTEGFSNPWLIGILVLWTASGAFCIWMGTREFQRATGQNVKKPTFRSGRILAGTYLVFVSLKSHVASSPNAFKADNEAQAAGMLLATILMLLVGMCLVAYSVKPRKSQSQIESISKSNSAQGET